MTETQVVPGPLIPGIVQDHRTGQVLMLGYLSEESIWEQGRFS